MTVSLVSPPPNTTAHKRLCLPCKTSPEDPSARFCMRCGSRLIELTQTEAKPLVGQCLSGRYRVMKRLAHSRMSEIHLAMDDHIGRMVVIKSLSPSKRMDKAHLGRFWQEVRTQWRVHHPLIAELYDVGRLSDGSPFMVMEHVRGQCLHTIVHREGAMSEQDALDIGASVCEAMAHVHAMGYVHRDLKPENVLALRKDQGRWRIKLIDFGLVLDTRQTKRRLTLHGFAVGTPEFMSPEQIQGQDVDGRADIYALGAVLVNLLTGVEPYPGEDVGEIVNAHLLQPVPSVRAMRPEISVGLDALIQRAMSKDPKGRFESMGHFREALEGKLAA